MHANIVLSQDALDYAVLFGEIADAYFELEMYTEAGPIYETLGADPAVRYIYATSPTFPLRCFLQTSSLYVLLQVATCRRMQGDIREACEVYKQGGAVIDCDSPQSADPT